MAGNYDPMDDIWPNRLRGEAIAPVRVGICNRTGRVIAGWPHVEQSIARGLATRYHERVMRYWCGSFTPHLIGRNTVPNTITRFWWAIATFLELWEPGYAIQRISVRNRDGSIGSLQTGEGLLTTPEDIRRGQVSFQATGLYMPRGHLGDRTPAGQKDLVVIGAGNGLWHTRTEE